MMDLDALEALRSDAVAKRAEAAQLFDVSYERYGEYRKTMERKARSAADAAYGASVDAFVVADKAARGAENALREAASDALPALITRLRAAEREASSAGVLRCKLTHAEAQIEAAERALEDVAPGLLAEHAPVFGAILELGARLRAADARTAWQPRAGVSVGEWVRARLEHVPQPVPHVEHPPARADGQQHGDDGEGV